MARTPNALFSPRLVLRLRNRKLLACTAMVLCVVSYTVARAQTPVPGADLHTIGEPAAAPGSIGAQSADVQIIFRLTNEDRTAQGPAALAWNPELAAAALAHARLMAAADSGELSHRYPDEPDVATRASQAGAHFSSIAENIAQGSNARQIEKQWMNSVPHRTNILDPRMNALGVAVFASGGTLYAVEDFAAAQTMLSPDGAEHEVEAELQAVAPTPPGLLLKAREPARQFCLHGEQAPASQQPSARFELQWESSSLALPQPLVQALRTSQYSAAAVGVCPASSHANQPFAAYHVAVLLY